MARKKTKGKAKKAKKVTKVTKTRAKKPRKATAKVSAPKPTTSTITSTGAIDRLGAWSPSRYSTR